LELLFGFGWRTSELKIKPEVIPDDEHELVIERVCAIDVAKASGKVCVRVPGSSGRRVSTVWDVAATTAAVSELAAQLVGERIERVTVESTSDYWRIWFYLLEAAGLQVQLVNARDVRNVPGRPKTDKLDAVWLAKLTEKGLLRPSFVPPASVRQLRDYTRLRVDLTRERARYWQRMEKLLEDALIKVSSVVSRLDSMSVRDMLEALIGGERDPRRLADLARGKMRPKRAALIEALTGRFDAHHGELARLLLDQIDALGMQICTLTTRIDEMLADLSYTPVPVLSSGGGAVDGGSASVVTGLAAAERLAEITGIGPVSAQVVLAEVGFDMTRFPTAAHLVSWAKLSPRTIQSGATQRGGKTGKGNPYLKGALGEAAAVAARTHTFLGERYRRVVKRRGKLKALVAVARSILVIVWNLLAHPGTQYQDLGPDYHTRRIDTQRRVRNHLAQLAALGYRVTVEPAA
jgi:transposase